MEIVEVTVRIDESTFSPIMRITLDVGLEVMQPNSVPMGETERAQILGQAIIDAMQSFRQS
jgi:hypothetical protein